MEETKNVREEEKKDRAGENIEASQSEKKPSGGGGKTCLWIGLIIIAVIIIGYFGLAWLLRTLDKTQKEPSTTTSSSSTSASSTASASKGDSKGVAQFTGTWETTCLTPDIDSPWGEQHKFVFRSDGTATHTRSSGDSCAALKEDTPQNYKISIPSEGKIDLIATDGGASIYDIYKFEGNNLRFGHGFCNCSDSGGTGGSDSSRINRINTYLVYTKK